MTISERYARLVIYVLVFASGFSGLVYEVVWTRMLNTVLGCTTYAVCLVLAAFMAGLGIGSFAAGRLIGGRAGVLKIYALIEACIGIFAVFSPLLLNALDPIYLWLHGQLSQSSGMLSVVRFLIAFAILLIPTVLMGATLPVLSQFFVRSRSGLGNDIGGIYGFNTVGATVGCFLTGFLLIEALGIRWTITVAAALNLAVATVLLVLSGAFSTAWAMPAKHERSGDMVRRSEAGAQRVYSERMLRAVLLAFGLSGFVSLGYEVLWTKAISFFAGNTSYAFSTMLTTFLLGIGLGSVITARFCDRIRSLVTSFGVAEILIGFCGLASIPMFARLFYVIEPAAFGGSEATPVSLKFLYSFLAMFLPTLIMGGIFPIVGKIYTRSVRRVGRSIGNIYSVNTLAGIFGSAFAGFLLVPAMGIQKTILLFAGLNLIIGLALIISSPDTSKVRKYAFAVPTVIAAVVASAVVPITGSIYTSTKRQSAVEGSSIYYKEGVSHIVEIIESDNGTRHLILDGGINASTASVGVGTRVHMMMAQLPLLLHDDPHSILLIALGSGMTAGATLAFENLERIDCAEISRDVVNAAGYFAKWNHDVVNSPRFNLHIEDGRNFVLTASRKYDVITTGIIHPKYNSGNASLYSKEYYDLCRDRLNESGVICQWAPLNGLTVREFKMILRTFLEVFPNSSLWFAQTFGSFGNSNALLIGSENGSEIDRKRLEERMRYDRIYADLKPEGIDDVVELLDCFVAGKNVLAEYVDDSDEITTDDRPLLEFGTVEMHYAQILTDLVTRREPVWPYLTAVSDDADSIAEALYKRYEVSNECIRGDIGFLGKDFNTAIAEYSSALIMAPENRDVRAQYREVQARAREHMYKEFLRKEGPQAARLREFMKTVGIMLDDPETLFSAGFLYQKVGWLNAAKAQYNELLRLSPDDVRARNNIAVIYDLQGESERALEELEAVIAADPSYAEPYAYSGFIHEKLGNTQRAVELYKKALEIDPNHRSAKQHLSQLMGAPSRKVKEDG